MHEDFFDPSLLIEDPKDLTSLGRRFHGELDPEIAGLISYLQSTRKSLQPNDSPEDIIRRRFIPDLESK